MEEQPKQPGTVARFAKATFRFAGALLGATTTAMERGAQRLTNYSNRPPAPPASGPAAPPLG
jgi:hypothetical protein